ncbi:MAG: LapA family protein [Alphaproteobacteria bacterium]
MRWIRLAVLAATALLFVLIALANSHGVVVSIDPMDGIMGPLVTTLPLYILLFGAAFIGIVVGSGMTWLNQSHHRKAAREAHKEKKRLSRHLLDPENS